MALSRADYIKAVSTRPEGLERHVIAKRKVEETDNLYAEEWEFDDQAVVRIEKHRPPSPGQGFSSWPLFQFILVTAPAENPLDLVPGELHVVDYSEQSQMRPVVPAKYKD